jgi:hypothetical protein
MAYLVRVASTGPGWQYIGRRVTLVAAQNLAANTARATGRLTMAVNERSGVVVEWIGPQDLNDTDYRAEQDAKHITPESY